MNLSGKKLTTAILAGLMGATMFGGSVFAEVTDQQILELQQGVNANTKRISQLENAQSTAKDYSTDIAANKKAIADETTARQDADTKLQGSVDANAKAITDEATARTAADTQLQSSVDANAKAIANEATARTEADTKLDTRITNVKDYLEKQTAADYVSKTDAAVQDGAVAKADKTIGQNVTNLDGALAKETAARIGADKAQDKVIEQVNKNVADGFNTINKNMADGFNALNAADQTLQQNIDVNADKINQNKQDIANIQNTLNNANALASSEATQAATKAANDATAAAQNATTVAKGLDDRITLISNNQTVTSESDLIKKKQSIGENLTNVDAALHKEIGDRIGADKAQDAVIQQVNQNVAKGFNDLNQNIGKITDQLNKNDLAEQQARADADAAEAAARDKADQKEAATRQAADQNLQNQINNNSTSINDLYGRYSSLKTDINKVGARSAALAGLHPLDFDPANKLNFAVASGSFKGENSVALGAFYRPNENIMFSAASTMGDSDNAYTFGLSFKIGPSSAKTKTTSPDAEELYKVVGELQDQLAAQQKEIEQLKADKAK